MTDVSKLSDQTLIDLALGLAEGEVSVLVEPALKRARIKLDRTTEPGTRTGRRRVTSIDRVEGDDKEVAERIEALRARLRLLADTNPVWLDIGKVFVVKLNGSALAILSDSSLVRRIYLNRERKIE